MKKVSKLISIFLMFSLTLLLFSCTLGGNNQVSTTTDSPVTTTTTTPTTTEDLSTYKFDSVEWSNDLKTAKIIYVSITDQTKKQEYVVDTVVELTKEATCKEEGLITIKATYNNNTYTKEIPLSKTEHSYVDEVIAPTYEAKGYTKHTCSVCGNSYNDNETDALVHKYSDEWSYDEENHYHVCIDEGFNELKDAVEAHTFGDWEETKAPTKIEEGAKHRFCTICNYEQTEVVPKRVCYTIILDLDGGTSESISEAIYDIDGLDKSFFAFDLTKEGYHFTGWWVDDTQIFDKDGNIVNQVELKDNLTFKAGYIEEVTLSINYSVYNPKTNELVDDKLENIAEVTGAGNYAWNSDVKLENTTYEGYTFIGWYLDGALLSSDASFTYNIGNHDATIEARYKFTTYNLTLKSDNPKLGLVLINNTGLSEPLAIQSAYMYYTEEVNISYKTLVDILPLGSYDDEGKLLSKETNFSFKMPNSDYNIMVYWNYFTISYELNGGENDEANPTSYTIEDEEFELQAPTKVGYTFKGWYSGIFLITKINPQFMLNYTLTANFIANTDTPYKVEHYKQNLDNDEYTLFETEDLVGTTDTKTSVQAKDYEGFTAPTYVDQISVKADGTSLIKIYYKRNSYKFDLSINDKNAGTIKGRADKYKYDQEITIETEGKEGYIFYGWFNGDALVSKELSYTFNMKASNLEYQARWSISKSAVTVVNHALGLTITGKVDGADYVSGNKYAYGSTITLTASVSNENQVKWIRSDGLTFVGNSYTFNVPLNDITITVSLTEES